MNKRLIIFVSIILLIVNFIACDDTITINDVDNTTIPDENVSFADHIYPLLQVKCAFSGCHASPSPADGLDFTTYANVTSDVTVVFPGEPDLSSMVWAIEPNNTAASKMPPIETGLALTENQINGIRTWIKEGAKNN